MRQWGVNNLPKVFAQQRHGLGSNPRLLDRKSDALPLKSHRATLDRMDSEQNWTLIGLRNELSVDCISIRTV